MREASSLAQAFAMYSANEQVTHAHTHIDAATIPLNDIFATVPVNNSATMDNVPCIYPILVSPLCLININALCAIINLLFHGCSVYKIGNLVLEEEIKIEIYIFNLELKQFFIL